MAMAQACLCCYAVHRSAHDLCRLPCPPEYHLRHMLGWRSEPALRHPSIILTRKLSPASEPSPCGAAGTHAGDSSAPTEFVSAAAIVGSICFVGVRRHARQQRHKRSTNPLPRACEDPLLRDEDIDWTVGPSRAQNKSRDAEIVALAWPAVLGASIDPVLSVVDTFWVSSQLGTVSLAALGPALTVEDWVFDILKTVQIPVRSLSARAASKAEAGALSNVVSQSLCLCWRIGIIVAIAGALCAPLLLRLCAVAPTAEIFEPARKYLVPRLLGSPALLTLVVFNAVLSGAFRDTRAVLKLVLIGACVNGLLTPLFIVGNGAGTAGAAWATTIACCVSACVGWRTLARRSPVGDVPGKWLPSPFALAARAVLFRKTLRADGTPGTASWAPLIRANAALTLRSFSSLTTWLVACALVTQRMGVADLAAHLCMSKVFLLLLNFLYGFQLAAQVLVSADVARGARRHGRWTAFRAIRLSIVVSVVIAAFLWCFKTSIGALLTSDAQVIAAFGDLAVPCAVMLLVYGLLWVVDGVLYGLGDYVWIATCTTLSAIVAVGTMLMRAHSVSSIWWCLNILTGIRLLAVLHRAFLDRKSPLAVG